MLKQLPLFASFTVLFCLLMTCFPANRSSLYAQADPAALPPTLYLGLLSDPVQSALSEVLAVYGEAHGYQVERVPVDSTAALLAGFAAGTLDLALALPVDALITYHQLPLNALPTDRARIRQLVQNFGEKEDIVWSTATAVQRNHTFWVRAAAAGEIPDLPTLFAQFSEGNVNGTVTEPTDGPQTICAPRTQAEQLSSTLNALQEECGGPLDVEQVLIDPLSAAPTVSDGTPLGAAPMSITGTLSAREEVTATAGNAPTATQPLSVTATVTAADGSTITLFSACTLAFDLSPSQLMRTAGLVPLPDPTSFFPANSPTLVYRKAAFVEESGLPAQLAELVTTIDDEVMADLLTQITGPARDPADLHAFIYQYLLERGQISLPTITVGTHAETAQWLLGEMVVLLLEAEGHPVVDRTGAVTTVDLAGAVETGSLDIAIALVGDLLRMHGDLTGAAPQTAADDADQAVSPVQALDAPQLVTDFAPASFSLTQVLLVDEDLAALGITQLSTLATYMNRFASPFSICMDSDFFSHPTVGLSGLETHYGFAFQPEKILLMDDDSLFPAIHEGRCQVTIGTITDGRIPAWNLVPLADDQGFFPPNNPLPIARAPLLTRHPRLRPLLESFLPQLDAETMQQMTTRIELGADGILLSGDEEQPVNVAREFLLAAGLLPADSAAVDPETVDVSRLE